MKVAIILNKKIRESDKILKKIESAFNEIDLEYDVLDIDNLKPNYDFVCSIGGDGTVLKATRFYAKHSTPVMGINVGRLGFLSIINPDMIDKLGNIIKNKKYEIKDRIMLQTGNNTAVNDIVIKGHSSIRTSKFNLYINNNLVSEYIADGIIISTPTGSTAYGLSAGGPIIHPDVDAMVIVPICAHTMTARPLVIPPNEIITIKSVDELLDVSCDGQEKISEVKEVSVKKSSYSAKLAFSNVDNFYSILQSKLHWGISPVSDNL